MNIFQAVSVYPYQNYDVCLVLTVWHSLCISRQRNTEKTMQTPSASTISELKPFFATFFAPRVQNRVICTVFLHLMRKKHRCLRCFVSAWNITKTHALLQKKIPCMFFLNAPAKKKTNKPKRPAPGSFVRFSCFHQWHQKNATQQKPYDFQCFLPATNPSKNGW